MKKLFLLSTLLLGLLLAKAGHAENVGGNANFAINYNLDATSFTYCKVTGQGGKAIDAAPIEGNFIKTTGSSTSITENVVGTNPFTLLAAKDTIFVTFPDGTTSVRSIVTRTDAANIVVDTAIDLSAGYKFTWLKTTCGTGVTAGWIDVSAYLYKNFEVEFNQGDMTGGLDVSFECKGSSPTALPVTVYPREGDLCDQGTQTVVQVCNFPSAGVGTKAGRFSFATTDNWNACRIGIKIGTADPSDVGTNQEQINLNFQGRQIK